MNAKKCDRCGKLYEQPNPDLQPRNPVEIISDIVNSLARPLASPFSNERKERESRTYCAMVSQIDLCEECKDSLYEWLRQYNCTEKEREDE